MTVEPTDPPGVATLRRLVGDPERFAAQHWGRAPLLRREAWTRQPPLTLDDVDRLLTASGLRWPAFRLVREGRTLPKAASTRSGRIGGRQLDDLADPGRVLRHVDDGATLVLQGLHRYHEPVAECCADLEEALGHPVQANAYLTPPAARGLDVHHDTHDVLALQTHGRKHWVVHEPAVTAPLPSQPWSSDRHEPGPLVLDEELAAGDLLYLPRGAAHAAETVGEVSLHLTIGVRVITVYDALQRAARHLADEPALRASLPIGALHDPERLAGLLADGLRQGADALAGLPADELADELVADRRRERRPRRRGQLRDLVELAKVDDDTEVRRRPGLGVALVDDADRVRLCLPDRELTLPAAAGDVLERLLDGRAHRVGDLADRLDEESRAVLVRRLLREGVLATQGLSA